MNRFHDIFLISPRLQRYISLPRIAAIGTQSSGKSSLIESIVGYCPQHFHSDLGKALVR